MGANNAMGRYGEQVAARHLQEAGLVILARNWRCARGEIDIIARDGDTLVVVEVKTRSSDAYGAPAAAVTPQKGRRLRELALRWLVDHRPDGCAEVRFDVVSVLQPGRGPARVEHLAGVL